MSLEVTAPTTVTSTNNVEDLTIYACYGTGNFYTCNSQYEFIAALTITSTVPQFTLGLGLAIAIGLVGLVLVAKKRTSPNLASTAGIAAAA